MDYNDSNSTSYSYDSLGNRTEVDDGTPTAYLDNNLNQYTSVGGTNYSYDNNGNLIDDGLFKFYYDCENRLTDVNDQSDTAVASYSYDYLGRRISKTVYGSPDVTMKYCYDGGQVIAEYDGNDNLLRKFIYGPGIDESICMIDVADSNAVYYYHFDGLGSVAALSDVNNMVVESYSYDVFGAPTVYDANYSEISKSAIGNPYMFTARRADDETALYYYRARYYAFDIGRFLQTDPIGYSDGLNIYAYVGNNPVNLADPMGLCKDETIARLEAYISNAEAAMIANIEILMSLHAEIQSTYDYYENVLVADTILSLFNALRSGTKVASGVSDIIYSSQPLGTNLLQEIFFGPGKNIVLANLGEKSVLKGANEILKSILLYAATVVPATEVIPEIFGTEVTIPRARRKMVKKYEQQAQDRMDVIYSLSQGISQAQQMLKELR